MGKYKEHMGIYGKICWGIASGKRLQFAIENGHRKS